MAPTPTVLFRRQTSSELLSSVRRPQFKKIKSCPNFADRSRDSGNDYTFDDADILFLVGPDKKKYLAHTAKLSGVSDVFRAMFMGPFKKTNVMSISDVDPDAFGFLLESIYEGVNAIRSRLTLEVAIDTYYAAHKYNMSELESFLLKFIRREVNAGNVLQVLYFAEFFGIVSVQSKCWSIIEKQTQQVIRGEDFSFVPWNILCGILENGRLTVNEFELFQAVYRWCMEELKREDNKGKRLTEIIGVAIYKLRFPLMSESEFKLVIKTGILNRGEIADLKGNFKKNTTYSTVPRKNVCGCRKNRIIRCKVCCDTPYPFVPIDGLGIQKSPKHLTPPTEQDVQCECRKYFSCPAFPTGTTARIMQKLNLCRMSNF